MKAISIPHSILKVVFTKKCWNIFFRWTIFWSFLAGETNYKVAQKVVQKITKLWSKPMTVQMQKARRNRRQNRIMMRERSLPMMSCYYKQKKHLPDNIRIFTVQWNEHLIVPISMLTCNADGWADKPLQCLIAAYTFCHCNGVNIFSVQETGQSVQSA